MFGSVRLLLAFYIIPAAEEERLKGKNKRQNVFVINSTHQQVSGSSIKASVGSDSQCNTRLRTNTADVNQMETLLLQRENHEEHTETFFSSA